MKKIETEGTELPQVDEETRQIWNCEHDRLLKENSAILDEATIEVYKRIGQLELMQEIVDGFSEVLDELRAFNERYSN